MEFNTSPESYRMPFGKFQGKTLDEIASTREGLLWLDWAAGELDGTAGDRIRQYVALPGVAAAIDDAMED